MTKAPKKPKTPKQVEALRHEEASRKNIPTAEYQAMLASEPAPVEVRYPRGASGLEEEKAARNRDLDPQLVWRGKDEKDWSDLIVPAPPLFIQEKVHPKVLIDDLMRRSAAAAAEKASATPGFQVDLFADFNGIADPSRKTEFYQHDANWTNRMILGDSLQVMASLAEREGLRGQVQCIYIDPPYGIKFNSNFQWSTTSRDVKDGDAGHITREPEQVKAFRDTWRDGIHSYLTYLRDRLTVARDLLAESGSIFVQIGDENVHLVRNVLDEIFSPENFCSLITYSKTTSATADLLPGTNDYILWYARSMERVKYRQLFAEKELGGEGASKYSLVQLLDGSLQPLGNGSEADARLTEGAEICTSGGLTSQRPPGDFPVRFQGRTFGPGSGYWKTGEVGMARAIRAGRVHQSANRLRYVRRLRDFSVYPRTNTWTDIGGIQSRADPKVFVVQTSRAAVDRCVLMSTDPGDLVLDPTCGSGTTATVSENWGRRWITIDTSRVALALARARVMGARYPYYLLRDSADGRRKEAELFGLEQIAAPPQGDLTGC